MILSEGENSMKLEINDDEAYLDIRREGAQGLNAETGNDLQAFIAKNGSPKWNAALDTDRATIKYGITQVDSTVVVDGNGKIAFMNLGPSGYQPLKDALTKVVV